MLERNSQALGAHSNPAKNKDKSVNAHSRDGHVKQLLCSFWQVQFDQELREEERDAEGKNANDDACGEDVLLNGKYSIFFLCAPVITNSWLHGVGLSINERLDKAARVEKHAVRCNGNISTKGEQGSVHQQGINPA